MKKTGATAEQLRADIDNGRMSDMISGSHPATVPLGADEEAAGTPIPAATIADARHQEPIGLPRVTPRRGLGSRRCLTEQRYKAPNLTNRRFNPQYTLERRPGFADAL